ncbi:MAG: ABC transporter substrate-binding protein [Acetobacteraceae bacterium]
MLRRSCLALAIAATAAVAIPGAFAQTAEPIRFGAILPLTGPGGLIGTQQQRGIQFALDRINAQDGVRGHKIEVAFEDNQGKADQSVLSFNKMADLQKLPVVYTAFSGPSLAMAPLATRKKVLLLNAGAQADALAKASPYLINTLPTIGDEIAVLSKWLVKSGKTRASILFENSAAGISGRDNFLKYFKAAGGTILAQEPTQFGQTDFRPALLKIADSKPDVMLVSITAAPQQMAQQYKQLGLTFQVAGTTFLQDPALISDPAAEGFIHTQLQSQAPPELAAEFKKKFGVEMEFFVRQYYNASNILFTALDKVLADGKPVTGENLRDAILKIKRFQGLVPVVFNSNTATVPFDLMVIRGGHDRLLAELKD